MRQVLIKLVSFAKTSSVFDRVLRYNPLYYRGIRGLLDKVDAMDFEARKVVSLELRERTVEWARSIPTYPGSNAKFSKWPILEKEELRANEDRFRNRRVFGIPASTGGTTGIPIRLWRSLRCIAAEQAFFNHLLAQTPLSYKTARIAKLCGDDVKSPSDRTPPFGIKTQRGRRLILSSKHVSTTTAKWFAETLMAFAPDILWIFPSAGEALARSLLEQHLSVSVPLIISTSEVLYPSGRIIIEKAFGSRIIDQYGLAERTHFAAGFQPGKIFFNPAYGHVELIPLEESAPPGLTRAEVISTGYWNEAMPLIRYRTGDRVLFPSEYTTRDLEEVSLGMKPITAVDGRENNFLLSPHGERINSITMIPRETRNIIRMQVIQESHTYVRFKVIPDPAFNESDRELLLKNIRLKLPLDMKVAIELVKELEQLPSGKIPYIIQRVDCSSKKTVGLIPPTSI